MIRNEDLAAKETASRVYEHVYTEPGGITTFAAVPTITTTTVTIESDENEPIEQQQPKLRRTQSMSTNTPPLISKSEIQTDINGDTKPESELPKTNDSNEQVPVKPPRKKTSRSTSPSTQYDALPRDMTEMIEMTGVGSTVSDSNVKRNKFLETEKAMLVLLCRARFVQRNAIFI